MILCMLAVDHSLGINIQVCIHSEVSIGTAVIDTTVCHRTEKRDTFTKRSSQHAVVGTQYPAAHSNGQRREYCIFECKALLWFCGSVVDDGARPHAVFNETLISPVKSNVWPFNLQYRGSCSHETN